jgi:glycosyltransferase involved in cell wall biosynthesis
VKVLHVTPYFHGAWAYGGIPRLSFHLAAAQAAQGHEVHVVTTDVLDQHLRRPGSPYEVEGVRVRVYRNVSNAAAYHLQAFFPLGLSRERLHIKEYDIVHLHGHRNLLNTRMAGWAHAAGRPVVLMPNGTLVNIERRRVLKKVYDLLWGRREVERAAALVAVSSAERRQFLALGLPADKVRVVPNGVAVETAAGTARFREAYGIKGEYILYLGKITPRKGIEHVIAALPLLDDSRLMLAVAGNDMGQGRRLAKMARGLGLAERVVFTGLITGPMKAAAYQEAQVTVYVGRDEIFGLVPWESLLCGTPVIVADDCGCGEWVAAAGAGYLVPYGDPAAIARVINTRDPERERGMVERGAAFCRERLSWPRIAEELVDYYEDIIAARGQRGERRD